MTVQELMQREPHLTPNEEKTGIYLIPSGKRGYTSFPVQVTELVETKVKRQLPEDYVIPEGITAEEREKIEFEIVPEQKQVISPNAVLLTPEEYEGIRAGTHCWKDGKVVLYTESSEVTTAKALLATRAAKEQEIQEAIKWFPEYDRKASEHLRCIRLNIPCHHNIEDLDRQAEAKKAEISAARTWIEENKVSLQEAEKTISSD